MNVFVFDIETVPDVENGRRLLDLGDLSDEDAAKAMFALRAQETGGSEFLRHHLHRVVAISAVFRHRDRVNVWSLGEPESDEAELIRRFFDGIDRFTPELVSWNGSGFDLPVLHYRAMLHGVAAPRYWDTGGDDHSFRYNNYLGRFHWRHIDLMDVLAGYQMRANAPLDQVASLLGFPGKMGMSGAKVWDSFLAGDVDGIRNYCETDVLNTYLVYLRFELMRGRLSAESHQRECDLLAEALQTADKDHLSDFLLAWRGHS
ncbi:MAG: 3'-5' exonuclease [Chromatiales bacterium]|nr:3'-5' exonuclease [Chromatiales bacterium]